MPEVPILVTHADFGDEECCGICISVVRGDLADLKCNECGIVIRTVAAAEAEQTLLQMAMSQGFCSHICPECGERNTFLGMTGIEGFKCRHCGTGVVVKGTVQ